ncbi:hypothetical protein GIB67_041923 [Kingdonia uniflora]|uniref:Uncharacterized protein n=1 Tax=Kingdonia uniflora TaxID=39325 RepID=A0A7J7N0Z7_9MAGN|nr:hypothetical protein GIB67_041923 [Kingdonia uniflora]
MVQIFATLASIVLLPKTLLFDSGLSPFALPVQLNQLKDFKARVLEQSSSSGGYLPSSNIFGSALYTLYISQNDFTSNLPSVGLGGIKDISWQVVSKIDETVKFLSSATMTKIIKEMLPPDVCVARDAQGLLVECCVSENLITGHTSFMAYFSLLFDTLHTTALLDDMKSTGLKLIEISVFTRFLGLGSILRRFMLPMNNISLRPWMANQEKSHNALPDAAEGMMDLRTTVQAEAERRLEPEKQLASMQDTIRALQAQITQELVPPPVHVNPQLPTGAIINLQQQQEQNREKSRISVYDRMGEATGEHNLPGGRATRLSVTSRQHLTLK